MLAQPGRGGLQRLAAACRQQDQVARVARGLDGLRRRLLQHQVRVGAADPERADAGTARHTLGRRPGRGARGHRQRAAGDLQVWVRRAEMQAGRNLPVAQRQRGLDQAGHAGGRVEVAEVGLDRADRADAAVCARLAIDAAQRVELDRVAERGGGAVGLHVGHRIGARRRPRRAPRRAPRPGPRRWGAVKPTLLAPSLLIAEPRITAWIVSPSARARSSGLSTTTPSPLPGTVPLAWASKARQWPSRERMSPSAWR